MSTNKHKRKRKLKLKHNSSTTTTSHTVTTTTFNFTNSTTTNFTTNLSKSTIKAVVPTEVPHGKVQKDNTYFSTGRKGEGGEFAVVPGTSLQKQTGEDGAANS